MLVNLRDKPRPKFDLYIGRRYRLLDLPESKWYNPFPMRKEAERPVVLRSFLIYMLESPELIKDLYELDDRVLACWCAPSNCHGNILLELRYLQKLGKLYSAGDGKQRVKRCAIRGNTVEDAPFIYSINGNYNER